MPDSYAPLRFLRNSDPDNYRAPNQFRMPRLRHIKWFKDMQRGEHSQELDEQGTDTEYKRTAPAEDLTDRFDAWTS